MLRLIGRAGARGSARCIALTVVLSARGALMLPPATRRRQNLSCSGFGVACAGLRRRKPAVALAALALATQGCGEATSSAADRWRTLRDSTLARTEVAAARIGDGAYVVGGFAAPAGDTTGVVERYGLRTDRWTRVRPIPQPVNH